MLGRLAHRIGPSRALRANPRRVFTQPLRSTSTQASRIDRITSKLPRRLRKHTAALRGAPLSHVVSFLILHELTAVIPLFALFGLFHYTDSAPTQYMTTHFGRYVDSSIATFERYFSRKGWFGFGKRAGAEEQQEEAEDGTSAVPTRGASEEQNAAHAEEVMRRSQADDKYKILVEVALAYAITKAALPIRIIGSVWATPWFARVLARARQSFTLTGRFRSGRFSSGRFTSKAADTADKFNQRP